MQEPVLEVSNVSIQLAGQTILNKVSFNVYPQQCVAIVGAGGSGKTTLLQALAGKLVHQGNISFTPVNHQQPNIVYLAAQHKFKNLSNTDTFYYQQRFNSEHSDDAITLLEALQQITTDSGAISTIASQLGLQSLLNTRLIQLSNGEHKKLQLAEALLRKANWLLLDSPFTGLDTTARQVLNTILLQLSQQGTGIIYACSNSEWPDCITHVAFLKNGILATPVLKEDITKEQLSDTLQSNQINRFQWQHLPDVYKSPTADFEIAVKMVNVNISYHHKPILQQINCQVNKGECWQISGPNGSGKSTLISLINGDNPQAFANEIYLFDKRKGRGETIWEIKQKTGYVSPEMHQYFAYDLTCFQVVASGIFDTIGLFRKLEETQTHLVQQWFEITGLTYLQNKLFGFLSNGQQRLILLIRALIKNPPLLILDEPCQGIDSATAQTYIQLVNDICLKYNKTLIYVSHYQHELPECITHVLQLEHGRIVNTAITGKQ
ncbi:ATP-binding cassette domain-containing protein [Limnovirga soli]|uniref:ATP-binding cassette domain-containing protein n=1 Tax=Limnovirga soli TaxID=2656915 RepID=A0A8J8FA86_9BACT|nr:ATP-binding cassette domain-containing protein [Limnovirga soli]NNV54283.1 ATP-binding cassette domain-containing protein [Limnovirga soli]